MEKEEEEKEEDNEKEEEEEHQRRRSWSHETGGEESCHRRGRGGERKHAMARGSLEDENGESCHWRR